MIRPKLQRVANGTRLTTDLVNAIINRTEYAADLLRQYKLIAGNQMYVEPHYDGTRVSYYYPVGGGATPKGAPITIPPSVPRPINPIILNCSDSSIWSKMDYFGYDVCPEIGPPCASGNASCSGKSVSGFIISSAIWPNSCLQSKSPKCSFSASFDDGGTIGSFSCPFPGGCASCSQSGTTDAKIQYYDNNYFFMYVSYSAQNGPQGGPYGFIGNGAFFLL